MTKIPRTPETWARVEPPDSGQLAEVLTTTDETPITTLDGSIIVLSAGGLESVAWLNIPPNPETWT